MKSPRIAVIHPQPKAGGGSENKALWMLETLKDTADVSFVCMGKIDLDGLNEAYGTRLTPRDVRLIEIPVPPLMRKKFDVLRPYRLERYVRRRHTEFDVLISTYNVMDFGTCGIQFISDFSFDDELRREFLWKAGNTKNWLYRGSPLRSAYLHFGKALAGRKTDGWKANWTVSNSDFGGRIIEKELGIKSRTIYPPVIGDYPDNPWENRENGFVALGRIVPEKRIDRMIRILGRVRDEGWKIHLHIIGKGDDATYMREIRELAAENAEWISLEGTLFGSRKREILAGHRYGIHACDNEFFGNAVAEMVKAGCLTWVPERGGPAEIVDSPELTYHDESDAVRKITDILAGDHKVRGLRSHLRSRAENFSVEKFQVKIRDLIHEFVTRET